MPEINTIFDNSGSVVGTFRFGVAWNRKTHERLGEYEESIIKNNDGKTVALFDGSKVTTEDERELGEIRGTDLFVNNEKVGRFIGTPSSGAAAIALLFT